MNEELKEKIKKVDILTDFDRVMIQEQSPYLQVFAYYSSLTNWKDRIDLAKKSIIGYLKYKKKKDARIFYSLFKGCPAKVIDDVVNECHQKKEWNLVIKKLEVENVGILSQNSDRFILNYLAILENFETQLAEINIIETNEPEIKNDIYTGEVKINVKNSNLIDFIKEKDYICGEDEKKILRDFDLNFKKMGPGLYVCFKNKIFEAVWIK